MSQPDAIPQRAPAVFVCENNLYATATPLKSITLNPEIATKAASYGMPGVAVDGNDVFAVQKLGHRQRLYGRRGLPALVGDGPLDLLGYWHRCERGPLDLLYGICQGVSVPLTRRTVIATINKEQTSWATARREGSGARHKKRDAL